MKHLKMWENFIFTKEVDRDSKTQFVFNSDEKTKISQFIDSRLIDYTTNFIKDKELSMLDLGKSKKHDKRLMYLEESMDDLYKFIIEIISNKSSDND